MISQNKTQDTQINTRYTDIASLNEKHGVFLVRDESSGRMYVKKILKTYNLEVYERLRNAKIKGLPEIFHMDENDGELIVIEQYISGETVDSILKNRGAIPEDQVRDIAVKLCDILTDLHSMDPPVIHRDIKPSNVMVTSMGEVMLLDLNAAKLEDAEKAEDTVLLGTYGYAAPEQFGFGSSTVQTDIYAVGMLMNTMLLGEYSKDIVQGSILSGIIEKCVMIRAEDRYKSAAELRSALKSPKKKRISAVPPGFRSGNPLHMFVAILGYTAIASISLSLETRTQINHPMITWYERIWCLVIVLAMLLFAADYLGIQQKIPLCRSKNILLKMIGVVLFDAILGLGLMFVMVAIEAVILK